MHWQLQEAKQRFSEVVRRALREGPQVVTRRGGRAVVVLAADQNDRLSGGSPDLAAFLLAEGPEFDLLDVERAKDFPREVAL